MTKKLRFANLNPVKLQEKTTSARQHINTSAQLVMLLILLCSFNSALAKTTKTDWDYYQKQGHTSPKWDSLVEAGFESFNGGNFNTAVSFFERARGLGCSDGLVLFVLASHQELQGNLKGAAEFLKQAEPLLRKAYAKHPATLDLSEHMGKLFYLMERYDEALPKFLAAIDELGEDFQRLYFVGQMYRMKKQNKEAIAYFEKALAYGKPEGAKPEGAGSTLPAPSGLRFLAKVELLKLYFESKDDDKTLEMANQILSEDPQNPTALSYRDQINHRRYKAKERKTLQRIIEGQ